MKSAVASAIFFILIARIPAIAADAQPAVPAFTTDPSQVETEAGDKIWKANLDKACAYLKTMRVPSKSEAQECQRLADHEPRCLEYRDFASIYLRMKDGGAVGLDVAEGLKAMEKNTALYPTDFFNAIRRLYQIVFFTDRRKLGTNDAFSERAYQACMSGHLL